jgi:hypothetical protein
MTVFATCFCEKLLCTLQITTRDVSAVARSCDTRASGEIDILKSAGFDAAKCLPRFHRLSLINESLKNASAYLGAHRGFTLGHQASGDDWSALKNSVRDYRDVLDADRRWLCRGGICFGSCSALAPCRCK